jgi:NAD-dependent SIR2 family protein deacetylase
MAKGAGAYTVEVNPEPTEMSGSFDEVLRGPAGEVLPGICQRLGLNIPAAVRVIS